MLLATVVEVKADGHAVLVTVGEEEEPGGRAVFLVGEPGVLAAVKEGEWVGRAVLLVAVEEGEAGVLVVEGEEGKHVLVAVEDLVSSKPK